ncbi:MAG: T9SS type A sorting domain-containing protein [Flavobacteriales bacterium]|nr:T9SS type A sorting domain-containing protein [Flavobacteriales bacterium]
MILNQTLLRSLLIVTTLFVSILGYSQLTVNTSATAAQLAAEIVGPGVTVTNVSLHSASGGTGIFANGGTTNIGLGNGILLTTGDAVDAIGPNNSDQTSKDKNNFADDPDLDALSSYSVEDQCILEFDFVATGNSIHVQYVFASEEYNEWVCTQYNDLFAFFVTGPNPYGGNYNSQNIALVPNTNMPVSINTINNGSPGSHGSAPICESLSNSQYYVNNAGGTTIGYDGFTVVMSSHLTITPGASYHFKFALADISDGLWDAGIFIKADSFAAYECDAGNLSFSATPPTFCSDDQIPDMFTVTNNSDAPTDVYKYILTNTSNVILAISNDGSFNLSSLGTGTFKVYGISLEGQVNGLVVGNNISAINASANNGCFALTAPLNVSRQACNPSLTCPQNQTLQCASLVPSPNPGQVQVASQFCQGGSVTWLSDQPSGTSCNGSIVRTYRLQDNCGYIGQCQQTFTYQDNTAPIIGSPGSNTTISCGQAVNFTPPTATDNCTNNPTIETVSDVTTPGSCPGTYSRTKTWRAVDACGNHSANVSQTITVVDNTAPVLAGLPNDQTVICSAMPTGTSYGVVANDLCDSSPTITSTYADVQSGCHIIRTITWTATDDCGNSSSASRTFTSNDNIAPTLIGVPSNATMQCGQPVPDAVVAATDNCDNAPVVSLSAQTVNASCGYSLIRTWTATDACGNTTSQSQTTTFEDTTDPVLVGLPIGGTVNCGAIPDGEDFEVTATDNCVNAVTVTSTYSDQGAGCNIVRTITWTATDGCGNTSTASRTFTSQDLSAPVLAGMPNDATVACGALPAGDDFAVFANDNCDPAVTITYTETDQNVGCNVARTITWTATDACGNSSSASRTFTSNDDVDPQLIGVPANATMQCGEPVPNAVVSAIDNCDAEPVVSMSAQTIPAECGYSLVRTWTVTDACGNTTSQSQTTTFEDTTDPVLVGLPNGGTVNCGAIPDGEDFEVTATDNCVNAVTVTSTYSDQGAGCNIVRTITWTATDGCGNTSTASRTFTSQDLSAPVLAGMPNDATVACGALPAGDDFAVFANDNCDPAVTITYTETDQNVGCNVARTITWTATDACGNSSSASRTFTSNDDVDPQLIGVPANATMQCGEPVPNAVVSAIDNCDAEPVVSMSAQTIPAECGYSLVRTWTATDACGNTTSQSQTTTFVDTTDPVLVGLPAGGTVNCTTIPEAGDFNVTATDNCVNEVTVTSTQSDQGSGCNITRTITWTAVDGCGNSVSASRTFTSQDNIPPVLSGLPENGSVACGGLPNTTEYFVAATDNCDQNVAINVTAQDVGSGCNVVRTMTWTATDDCGNQTTATRTFTTQDNTAPQLIGVPANATMQCGEPVPNAVVSAIDNCDAEPVVSMSAQTIPAECGYSLVRTWTVTDACGNTTSQSQTTTFEDTTDPVLVGLPNGGTVNCGAIPDGEDFEVTATDNCVNAVTVTSTYSDQGAGCNIVRTITWTATDGCGNTSTASRTFTSQDLSAPVLAGMPNDATVACGALPAGDDFAVFANDNCDPAVTITYTETDQNVGCNVARTITWTATDACGNSSSASRTFTSNDDVDPQLIGVPANATMQCGEPVPNAVVSAIDNCDAEPVVSMSAQTIPAECGYSLVRTWTATDACGNTTSQSQTTTFVDTTDPVLVGLPAGGTVNCTTIPEAGDFNVTATDNCVNEVTVTSTQSDQGSGCNITRTITWTAVDGCGNSVSASRTFTSQDNIPPVLSGLPENGSVACGGLPNTTEYFVAATDNCDQNVAINVTAQDVGSGCNVVRTMTWTATDDCGNQTTATRTFTTQDNTAPQLIGVPANATMQCGEPVPNAVVSAIDNCDAEPVVSMSAQTIPAECGYSLVRTWTVTDACGNTTSQSQTTTFEDTTDPVLVGLPNGGTVNCGAIPDGEDFEVTATDNCVNAVTVTSTYSDQGAGCNIVRTITWTATDGCGNTSTASRTFTSQDLSAPVLAGMPNDATVACGALPAGDDFAVFANDNCDPAVTITYTETDQNVGCNVARTITWTATDACGNSSSASRTFTSNDDVDPQLIGVPANATMQCGEPVPNAVVSAIDNCDAEPVVSMSAQTIPAECGYSLVRTWTVTDACGNTTSQSQTTTFEDTTDPVLVGLPNGGTVNCGAIPDGEDFEVTATDNCVNAVTVTSTYSDQGAGCNIVRTITWTATDGCGNTSTASRTFTSQDLSAPVLAGMPNDATVACGALPAGDDFAVFANDNCDPAVTITYTETDQNVGCNVARTITWTATDACGNSSSASRTFTSNDDVDPQLIGVPANATMQCGEPVPNAVVSAIDNCDAEPVVSMSAQTIQAECGYSLVRTWTATDACGNTTSQSQTTTFEDTIAPELHGVPEGATSSCMSLPQGDDFTVTATDLCDNDVQVTSSISDTGSGCNVIRTITWTAVDNCGNTTQVSRVFQASDETDPVLLNLPEGGLVNCGSIPSGNELGVGAEDDCDASVNITSTYVDESQGCHIARTITWTATDDCGNQVSASRTFISNDSESPILIGVPDDVTVNCGAPVPPAVVEAIDNCDTELNVTLSATTIEVPCGYAMQRTWSVTDNCGNTTTATQTTTFADNIPPVLHNLPTEGTFSCGALPDPGSFMVTASDNCDQEVVVQYDVTNGNNSCSDGMTITWTATDDCGNTTVASRTFGLQDHVAPVLHGNFDEQVYECSDLIPESNAYATDNCDTDVSITVDEISEIVDCMMITTRTITATDDCGNTATATQTIYIVDESAPEFAIIPQNLTVESGNIPGAPEMIVTDNCDGNLNITFSESIMGSGCPYLIKRVWTASDACGNTNEVAQIITVIDQTAPTFTNFSPTVQVQCGQLSEYMPTATDNSGQQPTVTLVSVTNTSDECGELIQRVFSATDQCGNVNTVTQMIEVVDTVPPLIHNIPNELFIQCGQALPEIPDDIIALDECSDDDVDIDFSQSQTGSTCPYNVIRTWTATDECGNSVSRSQVIHVINPVESSAYFRVYPNPGTNSNVRIQFSVAYDTNVEGAIYDASGRRVVGLINGVAVGALVYEWKDELKNLVPGSYVVKMVVGNKVYNKQFNIVR